MREQKSGFSPAEVCRHCGWLKDDHNDASQACPPVSELNTRFEPVTRVVTLEGQRDA